MCYAFLCLLVANSVLAAGTQDAVISFPAWCLVPEEIGSYVPTTEGLTEKLGAEEAVPWQEPQLTLC